MRLLWGLVHALQKVSKRMAQDLGVTGPQRLVLRVVGLFPGLSAGELAAILHVHPSTLTGVLQRLAAQKLIARGGDPSDRRRAVLHLTTRGALVNASHEGTVETAVGAALGGATPRHRDAARQLLEALTTQLEGGPRASGRKTKALRRAAASRPRR